MAAAHIASFDLGNKLQTFKKTKQTLFGICVRLVVFVAVLIILEAVLQQFLRVDFSKKGLYHSGVVVSHQKARNLQ